MYTRIARIDENKRHDKTNRSNAPTRMHRVSRNLYGHYGGQTKGEVRHMQAQGAEARPYAAARC